MDTLPLVYGTPYNLTDDDANKVQMQNGRVFPKLDGYTETNTTNTNEKSWTWVG